MKRIFALVLSFVFLLSCLVLPAGAMFDPSPVYQVQAASAYIVNTDTNIIVYDKDSTKQVSAGGLTKYMTLAVLLTNYADQLDNTFQMPFAISDYVYNTNNADMRSNETFTYREAMYAMLTRNANEAAMGVAYTLSGGDLDGWVAQMNTLSKRIGTTASSWTDACGIDSGNTTCAVDMYLILRYLMSFDAFVEVSGAPSFTMPAKEKHRSSSVLVSQNAALSKASGGSYYRSAMQGGMCNVTAFKNDTGTQSYVSWGNKDGATYIFCVMDSPDSCDTLGYANRRPALFETVKLMDWVFDSFSIQAALDTDLTIAEIPVKYSSDTDTLQLYPNDSMMTLLPSTSDGTVTQKYFHLPDYVCAPIQQGDVVGTVELKLAGETIGVVDLITGPLYSGKRTFAQTLPGKRLSDVQVLAADAADLPALADKLAHEYDILIATEVGGGVVPMDVKQRADREAAGRLACLLAARAECVVQMFCGIPTVLKGELSQC